MQVFIIISKGRFKINANVNVKNWLIKEYAIKNVFGIQVIVNMNVINNVILNKKEIYSNKAIIHVCSSCKRSFYTIYIVLFSVFLRICIGTGTLFAYFYWYTQKMNPLLILILALKQ